VTYRICTSRCAHILLLGFFAVQLLPAQSPQPQNPQSPPNPVLTQRPPEPPAKTASVVTPEGRIHLDVTVTDATGKPVTGLEPWDFKLLDENQPRKILSFHAYDGAQVKPEPPVEVILLIDMANLPFTQVAFVRGELRKFLLENDGHLRQPVSLFLLTDTGLRVQPQPSLEGGQLIRVLDQAKGSVQTITSASGGEGMLERFQLSIRKLTDIAENEANKPGRKLLIWVGPGWPLLNSSTFQFTEKDQRRYFDAIVELSTKLREARVALYSVSAADVTSPGTYNFVYQNFLKGVRTAHQADTGNLALKVLAVETGGRILGPDNNLTAQIESCIAEANAFYTLSFNPPPAEHADEYHDLKVQLNNPGLTVRTSSGYYDQPEH
jgi:VWFA-related protein